MVDDSTPAKRLTLFAAPGTRKGLDTFITERHIPDVRWEQFGKVLLIDSSGGEPHELPLPHELLQQRGKNGKPLAPPRRRLVIYVDKADDPEVARRVFIALTASYD